MPEGFIAQANYVAKIGSIYALAKYDNGEFKIYTENLTEDTVDFYYFDSDSGNFIKATESAQKGGTKQTEVM